MLCSLLSCTCIFFLQDWLPNKINTKYSICIHCSNNYLLTINKINSKVDKTLAWKQDHRTWEKRFHLPGLQFSAPRMVHVLFSKHNIVTLSVSWWRSNLDVELHLKWRTVPGVNSPTTDIFISRLGTAGGTPQAENIHVYVYIIG